MGTTALATAITPTLFFGDDLDIPHVYRYGDGSPDIREGRTVRVDSGEWALITLLNLGVSMEAARRRINEAQVGTTDQHLGTRNGRRQEEVQAGLEGHHG